MIRTTLALLCVLVVLDAAAVAQQFVTTGRDTLRGLPGVEILVELAQPELARQGLDPAVIGAEVERRLRAGGVTVYKSQSENPSTAKAYLYVHLNALALPGAAGYAIALQVHVRQTVRSTVTTSQIVNAMTWDAHNLVAVASKDLSAVRDEIGSYVDEFIQDWKAVHQPR